MATPYEGRCHCGAIGFAFITERAPPGWSVRACQCSFCRAHGACTTSDPGGSVRFVTTRPSELVRYRFALRTADFLLCRSCGVYVGAVLSTPRGSFATVNVNALTVAPHGAPPPQPVSYDSESLESRVLRREQRWTPVVGVV